MNKKEEILVTGAAGFIGFHTCIKLLRQGKSIIGFDNINSYYDVELKESRLQELKRISKEENLSWQFIRGGLEDSKTLEKLFENLKIKVFGIFLEPSEVHLRRFKRVYFRFGVG